MTCTRLSESECSGNVHTRLRPSNDDPYDTSLTWGLAVPLVDLDSGESIF